VEWAKPVEVRSMEGLGRTGTLLYFRCKAKPLGFGVFAPHTAHLRSDEPSQYC
jgi:hypothetical protein